MLLQTFPFAMKWDWRKPMPIIFGMFCFSNTQRN